MWEGPERLWRRLHLGREEYLQRLITTLIVGGDPPPWNTPRLPSEQGVRFLRLLDDLAHNGDGPGPRPAAPDAFIDECLLPKLEEDARNGWPDWAVLWTDRVWVIELKTEAASHRDTQVPYYLRLATAAHPNARVDLTYITGPLTKPAPALLPGQRYSHLTWDRVLPLIEAAWSTDIDPGEAAYVEMVRTVIENLGILRPAEQRSQVLDLQPGWAETPPPPDNPHPPAALTVRPARGPEATPYGSNRADDLLSLARRTADDGRQRGVGAMDPTDLEVLRDTARKRIGKLLPEDSTRFVLPWLWAAGQTGGRALTPEGAEFGYELRFSRYKQMQVKP